MCGGHKNYKNNIHLVTDFKTITKTSNEQINKDAVVNNVGNEKNNFIKLMYDAFGTPWKSLNTVGTLILIINDIKY